MNLSDLIAFSSPFERPLHFAMLELAVLTTTLLVLAHAIGRYRAGDRRHLFQWLVITSYGVQMELLAFNFLENYEHATFTVQLYHGQLPLYVTGLYGSFLYTGMKVAERMRVHPAAEVLLAGLAMCLIDVPFDIAGVALGWWVWLDTDPVLAHRWLGVPVTSYYWYLAFGAVATALCRFAWPRLAGRRFGLAIPIALVTGTMVIPFGVIAFLPFHGVHALGLSHGAIVGLHIAGCALLALAIRGRAAESSERLDAPATSPRREWSVLAVIAVLPGTMLAVLISAAFGDALDAPALQVGSAIAALLGLAAMASVLPLRRAAEGTAEKTPAPAVEPLPR